MKRPIDEQAIRELERKCERLFAFVAERASCPCCEGIESCSPDCTFSSDAPEVAGEMACARKVLGDVANQ